MNLFIVKGHLARNAGVGLDDMRCLGQHLDLNLFVLPQLKFCTLAGKVTDLAMKTRLGGGVHGPVELHVRLPNPAFFRLVHVTDFFHGLCSVVFMISHHTCTTIEDNPEDHRKCVPAIHQTRLYVKHGL